MGFSKKTQAETGLESESKKWVIAGIAVRSLKPIKTRAKDNNDDGDYDEEARSTTPTAKESRIPEKLSCPAAPRKRRPSRCSNNMVVGVREFFTPPDLETVFKCHVEKAI
ncbi:cyclin-dependent protein kinase inhibitor SMR6-like [Gastrolobium bilobum]|uniref:cyclin-dependent protein kinase inhibitor SMR6-like n=1 Tax=Gastrolobium bilobum TaxID=150636 RepID=UPI002AB1425C|nr:cyclin-dependent protein kinase inhibitor SMR6-like [Gastrolobium bilobum]